MTITIDKRRALDEAQMITAYACAKADAYDDRAEQGQEEMLRIFLDESVEAIVAVCARSMTARHENRRTAAIEVSTPLTPVLTTAANGHAMTFVANSIAGRWLALTGRGASWLARADEALGRLAELLAYRPPLYRRLPAI